MIEYQEAINILRSNGLTADLNVQAIRASLHTANYTEPEINQIISHVIANGEKRGATNGLNKVFRSDESFSAKEINDYLGITVDASELNAIPTYRSRNEFSYTGAGVWLLSFVIAIGGLLFYMYLYKVGVFHPSTGLGQ